MNVTENAYATVKCIVETMNEITPLDEKLILTKWVNKPWINDRVRRACKDRDYAYKKAIQIKTLSGTNIEKKEVKSYF